MILESKAIAASDASVKDGEMGGAWIIKNNEGDELLSNEIHHKEWNNNSNVSAEAIMLLELIQVIEWKSRHISSGKIVIALDCREVYRKVVKQIYKTNHIVCDGRGEIAAIKEAISRTSILIEINLKKEYPKRKPIFQQDPLQ